MVLFRVTGPDSLHGNIKFMLIHVIDEVAQNLLRTAADKGLDKEQNLDH